MKFKDVDLQELFQVMLAYDIAEVTLREGKTIVEVKRGGRPVMVSSPTAADAGAGIVPMPVPKTAEAVSESGTAGESEAGSPAAGEQPADDYHIVEAPLVGTFYRSPAPEAEFFVEVGDKVSSGDVLCIVEAMKSMNEIQTDVDGVVKEICVDNAALVEFQQPLFKIEQEG